MMTLKLSIDAKMRETLDVLRTHFKQPNDAAIFRRGIALLHIAQEADQQGRKLAVVDDSDNILSVIQL